MQFRKKLSFKCGNGLFCFILLDNICDQRIKDQSREKQSNKHVPFTTTSTVGRGGAKMSATICRASSFSSFLDVSLYGI